jgi:hypothetical protein
MVASKKWTPEAWDAAIETLRSENSVGGLFALYDAGAITSLEVVGAVWEHCHDKPAVACELVRVLREDSREGARFVAASIEDLLRQDRERDAALRPS